MSDTGYTPSAAYGSRGISRESPQATFQLQEFALNANILEQTNPWMTNRPDVIAELAQSGLAPDDLAANAAAMYGMVSIDGLRENLEGLTAVAQRAVYSKLTTEQQKALDQMGYSAPGRGERGFLDEFGFAGDVIGGALGGISAVGRPVIGGALDVLTFVGDQPAHLYRTIRTMDDWSQVAALVGAGAALALAPVTFGGSLAAAGTLASIGILGGSALGGATIAAAVTNPGEWWDALNSTWDGERVFTRSSQQRARELVAGDQYTALAKEIALELDPYELATEIAGERGAGGDQQVLAAIQKVAGRLADPGSAEHERIFGGLLELVGAEPFRQAIDTLQQGKISFGRDIARTVGMDPNSQGYSLLSGAIDGLWTVTMDPTMAVGAARRAYRVRRFGLGTAGGDAFLDRLVHLSNSDRLTRTTHETIARAVSTGDFTLMPRHARSLWTPLQEYRRANQLTEFDRTNLLEFFQSGDGVVQMLAGKATVRGVEHAVINRQSESSPWGRFVRELREFRNAIDDVTLERAARDVAKKHGVDIDLEAALPSRVLDRHVHTNLVPGAEVDERAAGGIGRALGTVVARVPGGQTVGSLIASITSMTPPNRAIRVLGEGMEDDLGRFVETMGRALNMPSNVRDEWLNMVMAQGSSAQRIAVVQSFLDTGFTLGGLRSTPELSRLADTYLHKYGQAYALGGLDRKALDGIPAMTGVLPAGHQAALVVMPDLAEMLRVVRRGHLLKHVAKITDTNLVETSMSRFWKPSVLLRIGFIPRAAGEEALAWAARMTEGGVGMEYAARTLAKRSAYEAAAAKQAAGEVLTGADLAALKWRVPAAARPLVRRLSGRGWADPVESFLDTYGRALRGFLDEGLGHEIGGPQWYHGLVYGRAHSWRRLVANGVDPVMRDAADLWVNRFADSVMRATSAGNASLFEHSIVNPDVEYFLVEDPKNPGQLIEEPLITLRGQRIRVEQGDPRYAGALHHRMGEIFDDDVIGDVVARAYTRYFPGFDDLTPARVYEAIIASRQLTSWTSRKLFLEALQGRADNWRAAARVIGQHDPQIAGIIDELALAGDVEFIDLVRELNALASSTKAAGARKRYEQIAAELNAVAPVVDEMNVLSVQSGSWLSASLSADVASGGTYFDQADLLAWVSGQDTTMVTSREQFLTNLRDDIYAELQRPENAEFVRQSRFSLETADGRRVAHPLQEGLQRIYHPVIGDQAIIDDVVSQVSTHGNPDIDVVTEVVDRLLAQPHASRLHTEFIQSLPIEARREALGQAVLMRLQRGRTQWTQPQLGIAYEDPRVAQWVGDVLTGGTEQVRSHAYIDLPRGRAGADMRRSDVLDRGGGMWQVGHSRDADVVMIDGQDVVTLPDGSVAPGVSFDAALRDWADTIVRKVTTEHTSRTREVYRPKTRTTDDGVEETGMFRVVGRNQRPLEPGEQLGMREELFDGDGNPIKWGDPRFFDIDVSTGQELLWPVLGPMMRDQFERPAGFTSVVERRTRDTVRRQFAGERVDPDGAVAMTRSRIDDIHKTRELDLPNVALSEVRQPRHDTLWDRVVRYGFDKIIGPSIDALVRQPMSFHYFAAAYRQNRTFRDWMLSDQLFGELVPARFADELDALTRGAELDPKQIAAARLVAARSFSTDLTDVADEDVLRWLSSIGDNAEHYLDQIGVIATGAARRRDKELLAAARTLSSVDIVPLKLLGVAGDGPAAQRLVDAYDRLIPGEVWDKGQAAVNRWIADEGNHLPLLETKEQFDTMRAARNNWASVNGVIAETASQRALENVVPFLDSHEQRTQFSVIARNMLPFWYAEENFLKRWGRVLANDGTLGLATIRKAQLAYMGIRSAGIVRTDQNGKDWFVYPGSGLFAEVASKLPFMPDTVDVGTLFQASTDSMLPGINARFGTPSPSPFVAVGLDAVTRLFPDAVPLKRAVLGDVGSSQGAMSQFVPTTVRRVWEAAFGDEESSARYAAAMMSAAALMEAEGNGLPDNATAAQLDEYLDRLRNHARMVMWAQVATGFVVPGAPVAITTGEDVGSFGWLSGLGVESPKDLIGEKYRTYVQNLGVDEGTARFLADFPDSDLTDIVNPLAFTVSSTTTPSGAPLPATRTAMAWYEANKEWIDSMPEAGAWFLPPDTESMGGAETFDYYSYSQQLVSDLRKRRTPTEFVTALKFRQGATQYFDAKDQYEAALAQTTDRAVKAQLDAAWQQWSSVWMQTHPIFAEELATGEGRKRRARTIEQLRYAVDDPSAPESPHLDAIRELSRTFDQYQVFKMEFSRSRSAESQETLRQVKAAFEEWGTAWTLRNPQLEQLWTSVFRTEAEL